jgi:hypothetical protein
VDPIFTALRIDKTDPQTPKSRADSFPPIRVNDRIDIALPALTQPSTEVPGPPMRCFPKMETDDPSLVKHRIEQLDPNCTKLSTLTTLPNRPHLRRLTLDDNCTKSRADMQSPKRANDRNEIELPSRM